MEQKVITYFTWMKEDAVFHSNKFPHSHSTARLVWTFPLLLCSFKNLVKYLFTFNCGIILSRTLLLIPLQFGIENPNSERATLYRTVPKTSFPALYRHFFEVHSCIAARCNRVMGCKVHMYVKHTATLMLRFHQSLLFLWSRWGTCAWSTETLNRFKIPDTSLHGALPWEESLSERLSSRP